VVVEPSRDHPTFRFERDRGEPALERTSLEISLRNNIAFLDWFYVTKKARNSRLGRELYSLVELTLLMEGIRCVRLYARGETAQKFWMKNGFNKTEDYQFEKLLA
jgi:GNAT superfamily N-acetyltransferase